MVMRRHARAGRVQRAGYRPADAPARAGDENGLVGEVYVHGCGDATLKSVFETAETLHENSA